MHLSDLFKFTQGLGQKGHQIGRKVGDAIELLTYGMINLDPELSKFLVVEQGVEGETAAKHKVEFSFYNIEFGVPSKKTNDLFGLIECKKVGVEQTIKQNFKIWKAKTENKKDFHETNGYSFKSSPTGTNFKWSILIKSTKLEESNLEVIVTKQENNADDVISINYFNCEANSQVLIAVDVRNKLYVLGPNQHLSSIKHSLNKCIIIQIKVVDNQRIKSINVNESLPGPQTPEKAKQSSFVSLDVRRKVLGRFDKTENQSFISILVIGEASHWEDKSRSIVRLCNDFNLIIPDEILVYLFVEFEKKFGKNYQSIITKTNYQQNTEVKILIYEIINHFNYKILRDMDTHNFVKLKHEIVENSNRLVIELL